MSYKNRNNKGKLLPKNEGSPDERYKKEQIEVFLNRERINVCEHTVKVASHDSYYVFTYNYSLLIEKGLCEYQNVSFKFPCVVLVYFCLSSEDLLIYVIKVSSFFFLFCVICALILSLSKCSQ